MRVPIALTLLILTVAMAVPTPVAGAAALEIKPGKLGVSGIGPFRPKQDATVAAAIRAFGEPSAKKANGSTCRMRWDTPGLRILFANFGGAAEGKTTCSPDVGRAQSFSATGPDFLSWKGLRVGARRSAISKTHPNATRHRRSWWLRSAVSPFGTGAKYAVVKAVVADGRVKALAGWIGEAGE